jgi:DNA-binding response OmpR family regulator
MTACPNCGFEHRDDGFGSGLSEIPMPNSERIVLSRLIKAHGAWVKIETLIDTLYGHRWDGGSDNAKNNVETHISKLRKKMIGTAWEIKSERFLGYRLVRADQ